MDPEGSVFPISILLYLRNIIKSGTPYLCNLVLSKLIPEAQQRHAIIVRIWAGLVLTIFCCCVAWRGEVHRPKITIDQKESGWLAKKKEAEMWRVWLVIQFFLLGIMEGLAKDGLDDFFDDQVSESMKSCGSAFTEFVIGIGSLLNGFCVFICRSWFAGTLNGSRLDKYYQMLTVVSFISLCYYWYVSTTYTSSKGAEEDVKQETATEFAV